MEPLGPQDDETTTSAWPEALVCAVFWLVVVLYITKS